MKRYIRWTVAAMAVAGLTITGCSTGGSPTTGSSAGPGSTAPGEPVTLTFWGSYGNGGNSAQQEILDNTLIPAFEKAHPVEANAVFMRIDAQRHKALLARGWRVFRVLDGSVRFMCSCQTSELYCLPPIQACSAIWWRMAQ